MIFIVNREQIDIDYDNIVNCNYFFITLKYFYMVGKKINPEENPAIYNDILIDFQKFKTIYSFFVKQNDEK